MATPNQERQALPLDTKTVRFTAGQQSTQHRPSPSRRPSPRTRRYHAAGTRGGAGGTASATSFSPARRGGEGLYAFNPNDLDTYTLPGLPVGSPDPSRTSLPRRSPKKKLVPSFMAGNKDTAATATATATATAAAAAATSNRDVGVTAGAGAGAGAGMGMGMGHTGPGPEPSSPAKAGLSPTLGIVQRVMNSPAALAASRGGFAPDGGAGGGGPETDDGASSPDGGPGGPGDAAEAVAASANLQTGEDAIAFFARFGTNSAVKFVHLNRAETGDDFRPYNLLVVPQGETNPEYFTMSAKGVVHICPGKPSEFVSLSEWMRESTIFNVLTSMNTFKYYLPRKMFQTWRSNIRYNLYCQQRKTLSRRLFWAKPSFCGPLMEILRLLYEMRKVELLDMRSQKTFEIAHFIELQAQRRNEASKQFDSLIDRMREVVEKVCADVSKRARRSDGGDESKDATGRPARNEKSKSMLAAKQEQARRERALKRAAQEKAMLGEFVRHVDYMVISSLAQLVIQSAAAFMQELVNPSAIRKTGLFETTVRFGDDASIEFVPANDAFVDMVGTVFDGMITMVSNLQRILYVRAFKSYVAGLVTEAPTAAGIVRDSTHYRGSLSQIHSKFEEDFEHAASYAEVFEAVRPIYLFDKNDEFSDFASGPMNVHTIKAFMSRIQDWEKELEKMRVQHMVGVLHVEGRKLKFSLTPVTTGAMVRMQELLIELASSKCKDLLEKYEKRLKSLDHKPQYLAEFAGFVEKHASITKSDRELNKDVVIVDEMYRLLHQFEVKVSHTDQVQLDDLRHSQSEYADLSGAAGSFLEEKMPDMTVTLDKKIIKLKEQLGALQGQLAEGSFVDPEADPASVLEDLEQTRGALGQFEELSKTYNKWQSLFNIPAYEFKQLAAAQEAFKLRHLLWNTRHEFESKRRMWDTEPFLKVDVEELNRDCQMMLKTAFVTDKKLHDDVSKNFKAEVQHFRTRVPCIMELGNPNMKERHWEKLYTGLGQTWIPGNEAFTLEELATYDVFANAELVTEVSGTASGEAQLEASLDKIRDAWADLKFNLKNHRDNKHVFILAGLDDIFTLLEDNQVTLQTMLGSRYITGVRDEVESWERKLSILSDTLDEWVQVQRNWMYLETIFTAEDIQKQLPAEAAKFQTVDKMWKDVMKKTNQNPLVLAAVEVPEGENPAQRMFMFQKCNKLLEEIQKSLEDYLETKRSAFPRFYFLSNDELLAILSQTRDVQAVQPHLSKCFDSMKRLDFGKDPDSIDIFGMISMETEHVPFSSVVSAVGNVENWLTDVQTMMRTSLYDCSKRCMEEYPAYEEAVVRDDWFFNFPAQACIAIDQVFWAQNVENAIRDIMAGKAGALDSFLEYSLKQIDTMVELVRGPLTKLQRTLLGALVVVDVHARDVIKSMIAKGVDSLEAFEWTRQLRYYWDMEINNCVVRQTNTRFVYGYEYLGNSMRLVITPLTDKCYMTLTGALHLRFGGAPAGPAGTGKTETVKDLAKALANQCVVFNCSDGLDYKMMGRFFSGLAQCGAWSCFDEFNRIDIEVLSVIAQQILCIQQGLQKNATHIDFEGREMPLSTNFGVFITMNPGYAGRTELPDNLKALFRPVAMMVPDYRLIAEIILFSQGFADAFALSNKMSQLYKLSSEQLSKQDHYDFGMRAVKSVLVAAGQLKRKEPDVNENILLIRAMRDSNVPKFLEHDLPLFRGILADLFPGVTVPFVDYGALQVAIERQLEEQGLQRVPKYITKIIQVHETQLVRHGMMVVGEAGGGKTCNTTTLARALTSLHAQGVVDKDGFFKKVERHVLNPKSITMGELYGEFNPISNEWTDGLVAFLVRQAAADPSDNRKWLMFDGPVDTLWIESMNTVLDDNKILCLNNGERIKLPPTVHVMFEVLDLAVASPATVSRCGMVYMEQIHVGLLPIIKSWAETDIGDLLPRQIKRIVELMGEHVPAAVAFLADKCRQVVPTASVQLLQSFLNMLDHMLRPEQGVISRHKRAPKPKKKQQRQAGEGKAGDAAGEGKAGDGGDGEGKGDDGAGEGEGKGDDGEGKAKGEGEGDAKGGDDDVLDIDLDMELDMGLGGGSKSGALSDEELEEVVNMAYCFAFIWSFGGNVDDASRPRFNTFALKSLGRLVPDSAAGADLYNFCADVRARKMVRWVDMIQPFKYEPTMPFFQILVPTTDTTRYSWLLSKILDSQRSVLYVGDTGVGKSVIVADTLARISEGDEAAYVYGSMNFSAQTKSANLQEVFETKLDKKRKNLLGAPSGKTMVLFIDDLNMPEKEIFGAQPPIELLRQVIDLHGFYDRQKLFFKAVKDTLFVSCCAPPGGGRNDVTLRLSRHFHQIWMTSLSEDSMTRIFGAILEGFTDWQLPDLTPVARPIVEASIDVYQRVTSEMLPTPTKSHYTFNLRDLSKVFQGMLMTRRALIPDRDSFLRLWLHEAQRVFRDRLINDEDREAFNSYLASNLASRLDVQWETTQFTDVLFGDYLNREERQYREVLAPEKLQGLFDEYLEEYNVSFSNQMHLVFFKDAIAHISRICRILRQPRGNALLVGVGGSGRQSLTRLACFVSEYKCSSIEITRGYGSNEWQEDLKGMLMAAGIKQQHLVFLFSDTQIVKESFLEDINNLLNAGDIPNLYAPDEMEAILGGCRAAAQKAGIILTRDNIFNFYIQLVREHLHIVLAMSPIGDAFRTRCRMFPSMVNCCTIDWFNPWPEDALFSVAQSFLSRAGTELGIEELVTPLCHMCVKLHRSVEDASERFLAKFRRHNYTTPTSYLELIRLYTTMLKEQREVVTGKIERYRGGLQKLGETNEMVVTMQRDLKELQPVLAKAAKDTSELLVKLAADQKEADAAAEVAAKEEAAASKMAAEVQAIKDDCQADLDEALPAYYSALKALDKLDKKQIQEVKSFANPPKMVGVVMEAVCVLLGRKPTWEDSKKLLNDMKFLDMLKNFDKDNLNAKVVRKVKPYVNDPEFTPEKVKSVSAAAMSLCSWVVAIYKYDRVAKTIAPKRARLKGAEEDLAKVMGELAVTQAQLKAIQDKVAELKASFEASLKKRDDLEAQKAATTVRMERAKKLTDGLGDEAVRWTQAANQLDQDLTNLVGNIVLSAGCVAYIGPFSADFRSALASEWVQACKSLGLPVASDFQLVRILADPVTVRDWQILGLPADDFSTANGLFATLGRRWPLMIDPQGQANRWVKNLQRENNLQVIKLSQPDFLRTLENAIRFGQPVLLENVEEELDPSLEPVLLKQTFKKGGQLLLHLGDSDIPYSEEFKLYITTKLANPHYMPEVCIKATVINFTVTMKGLEDQLLVDVVKFERPDLEQRKDQLIVSIANDKRQLKGLEDKILYMLANSSGDILEDEELINNLAASKTTSTAISERMTEAEATTAEIQEAREEYRPVATRGSILYFVVADMSGVDPMYQYSLQAFTRLYNLRIERSEKNDDLAARVALLIEDLTRSFYVNVCRGLFEKDKLLYSFLIASRVLEVSGELTRADMNHLLIGSTPDEAALGDMPAALAGWVSAKVYGKLVALDGHSAAFAGLKDSVVASAAAWRAYATCKRPETEPLPCGWQEKLSPFNRLLVLRVFREEKTVFAVREFVGRQLGPAFMEAPPFDLNGVYNDSTAQSPIIFVLSPGADPIDYLLKLAADKGKAGPGLKIISLGQGQGPIAEKMMEAARLSGDWVCLQNCHLAVSWLPRLEAILEQTTGTNEHEDYRLWLTSMPSNKFPVPVLQSSIKLTQEPPRGLRANIMRTFADIDEEEFEGCTRPRAFKKLLFGLAFYHALILERRKFGAIGWNIPYEWMNSDLKTGIMQLRMYLEEQPDIPYETLNAVIGDITYGGRATDAWDKRTNLSVLLKYFNSEIMSDGYKFSPSGVYFAPPEGTLAETRAYAESLPMDDAPETFGLHDNADITLQNKETTELLKTLVSIQPREASGASGKTPDELVLEIANDIDERMPALFRKADAHPSTFAKIADGSVNSLGVFCDQEMTRFNKLIQVIGSSIKMLKRAIKGLVVMSADLEVMHTCFQFQLVPPAWEKAAYPSLKPLGSWVTDLVARLAAIDDWLKNGSPATFWLSGFFFPQGFMTGALQVHSRKTKIAVDTLGFKTHVMKFSSEECKDGPEDGVYVHGLFLEGARWDQETHLIAEMKPSVLFCSMPVIWMDPALRKDVSLEGMYTCPVYKTSRRAGTLSTTGHSTNFIVELHLPSDQPSAVWIRRGVALLSQLDT